MFPYIELPPEQQLVNTQLHHATLSAISPGSTVADTYEEIAAQPIFHPVPSPVPATQPPNESGSSFYLVEVTFNEENNPVITTPPMENIATTPLPPVQQVPEQEELKQKEKLEPEEVAQKVEREFQEVVKYNMQTEWSNTRMSPAKWSWTVSEKFDHFTTPHLHN